MPEPFDTTSIPDDEPYWDALAARVALAAVREPVASDWLSSGTTPWIAAAALACAASLVLALVLSSTAGRGMDNVWSASLAPRDAVGRTFASGDAPPGIGEILVASQAEARP
ncbi:MAG: hypothetical protein ABI442_04755 [Gemmatimonadaceae bacterium]